MLSHDDLQMLAALVRWRDANLHQVVKAIDTRFSHDPVEDATDHRKGVEEGLRQAVVEVIALMTDPRRFGLTVDDSKPGFFADALDELCAVELETDLWSSQLNAKTRFALPTTVWIARTLSNLCRAAEGIQPKSVEGSDQ